MDVDQYLNYLDRRDLQRQRRLARQQPQAVAPAHAGGPLAVDALRPRLRLRRQRRRAGDEQHPRPRDGDQRAGVAESAVVHLPVSQAAGDTTGSGTPSSSAWPPTSARRSSRSASSRNRQPPGQHRAGDAPPHDALAAVGVVRVQLGRTRRDDARLRRTRAPQVRWHVIGAFPEVRVGVVQTHVSGRGQILAEGVPLPRADAGTPFRLPVFRDVPIRLTAVPDEGYVFTGWSGLVSDETATTSAVLTGASSVTAHFVLAGTAEAPTTAPVASSLASPSPTRPPGRRPCTRPSRSPASCRSA